MLSFTSSLTAFLIEPSFFLKVAPLTPEILITILCVLSRICSEFIAPSFSSSIITIPPLTATASAGSP